MSEINGNYIQDDPHLHLLNRDKTSSVGFQNDVFTAQAKSGQSTHAVQANQIAETRLRK